MHMTQSTTHAHAHAYIYTRAIGRIPLDEGSARRIHLYVSAQYSHKKQTTMPPAKFEPAIQVSESRPTP